MSEIKFSHKYPKMWNQIEGPATLLAIRILDAKDVQQNKDLIEYDTYWNDSWDNNWCEFEIDIPHIDGYYPLPTSGKLIQLIFIGCKDIPFCTLRRHTEEKEKYYAGEIGKQFKVVLVDEEKK
jgi:hypothetical protein